MKVLNIHTRKLNRSKAEIEKLFATLATENDLMLANNKWSPMILDKGLAVGSQGGHGPIGYSVKEFKEGDLFVFQFSRPKGFVGTHRFEINELNQNTTELKHVIDMRLKGMGLISWPLAIRWLHDAFIEDAFDKVTNHFSTEKKRTEWSAWVKFLRLILKPLSK